MQTGFCFGIAKKEVMLHISENRFAINNSATECKLYRVIFGTSQAAKQYGNKYENYSNEELKEFNDDYTKYMPK